MEALPSSKLEHNESTSIKQEEHKDVLSQSQ
jgi:hypothetical protein